MQFKHEICRLGEYFNSYYNINNTLYVIVLLMQYLIIHSPSYLLEENL